MTTRTELEVNENSYAPVMLTLTSDGTTAIASASIDSIEMTLIDVQSGDIVNSRQKQDVFGANNCTMHATSGLFTWTVLVLDTTIVGTTPIGQREHHLATLTVTWDTTKQLQFEIQLNVLNLRSVPQVAP